MGGAAIGDLDRHRPRCCSRRPTSRPWPSPGRSKRLGLRTEASARFERGSDPWGIDRAADRFCELLAVTSPGACWPAARSTCGARSPPVRLTLELGDQVNELLGTDARRRRGRRACSEPLGFACEVDGDRLGGDRPDQPARRPARPVRRRRRDRRGGPASTATRGSPAASPWPQPGGLTGRQRERRSCREAMVRPGRRGGMDPDLRGRADHARMGLAGPAVDVANPLGGRRGGPSAFPAARAAAGPGLERRPPPGRPPALRGRHGLLPPMDGSTRAAAGGAERGGRTAQAVLPGERERLSWCWRLRDDDARTAVAAWRVLVDALTDRPGAPGRRRADPGPVRRCPACIRPVRLG